jgi:hypothetical protein
LSDEEVVSIAVRGLLPAVRERIGTDCSNLGMLARRIANLESQYRYSRYNKVQKAANVGFEFGPPFEDIESEDEEEENDEIAAVNWAWKHSEYIPWAKAKSVDDNKKYSFDISHANKIFDFLLEKGQIKLTGNHKIPSAEELKKKKYCKYHNSYNRSTNECRVFKELIQRAIDKGRIGVEKNKGDMNIEGHPFPMNMIASSFSKGKFKVLTSKRARKAGTIDSEKQISAKEYQAIKMK